MSGPCTDCGGPDYQTLEARIAEMEANRDELIRMVGLLKESLGWRDKRLEQAEAALAERDRDRDMLFGRLAHAEEFIRRHHLDQEFSADLRARAGEGGK